MAKDKLDKAGIQERPEQQVQSPKPQGSEAQKKKGKNGILFGLFAVLTAVVIMLAVIGGAFYFVVHNNISGLGERYRKEIQRIPVLKLALPAVPDPEDPKYIPDEELRSKYIEMKDKKDELNKQVEELNKQIEELNKYKDNEPQMKQEADAAKKEAEDLKTKMEQEAKNLAEEKKKFDELVAAGDKNGFKEFFEKMDKDTAQKIYGDIIKEEKVAQDTKNFAKLYETMEPSATAKIFEEMGNSKIDLVVETIKNMKREVAAEVLAGMDAAYAGKVTEKLAQKYNITFANNANNPNNPQ